MRLLKLFVVLAVAAGLGSCASIVTRSDYPVAFNSVPVGAQVTVENRDGFVVYNGRTPSTIYLEASAGYMRPERYKVTYRQPGREPVTNYIAARLDGWFFGNLLFGPPCWIGMLIIDPLTGAMYKLPSHSETLSVSVDVSTGGTYYSAPVEPAPPAAPASSGDWTPLGE
ncbi:MAG: hypothetical protein LBV38_01670 [Alistipes sp.]|jgi:hypothetical protein|nr:hypothetical protein [Alistipes sp.]